MKTNQIIYWKFVKEHLEISLCQILISNFEKKKKKIANKKQTNMSIRNITVNNSGVIYVVIVIYTGHTYYIYVIYMHIQIAAKLDCVHTCSGLMCR